jgi:hypothetical protein
MTALNNKQDFNKFECDLILYLLKYECEYYNSELCQIFQFSPNELELKINRAKESISLKNLITSYYGEQK